MSAPRSKGLPYADLPRALGYGNQHDVHHADAADGESQSSNEGQDELQSIGNSVDDLHVFDRVVQAQSAFIFRIEAILGAYDLASLRDRRIMKNWIQHLPDDRRNIRRILNEIGHGIRNECAIFVGADAVV